MYIQKFSSGYFVLSRKKYLEENKIPGKVFEFPFETFGKSRTRSFLCGQEWIQAKEKEDPTWSAKNTWALFLDGDMMLGEGVSKEKLASLSQEIAGVTLKQANGSLVYSNVRLARLSEPWICKGATHEAWTCPHGKRTELFNEPVLIDHNDGGCKADKYPRDVRLLLQDLEEMPNDARTHFYLGQTYLCMREYEKGIPVLRRRIEIGGWEEEVYIAYMYLGECLMGLGKKGEAIQVWLDGWQYRQHRTEIPIKLIQYYRYLPKSQYIAGMFLEKLFATQFGEELRTGAKVGKPVQNLDVLFVNKRDLEYHIFEEMSILAFYTNMQRPTWLRLDAFDLTCQLNWWEFNTLFGQMHWYDWLLKPKQQLRLKPRIASMPWADEDDAHVWQPFNPSIRQKADKSGYELNLRCANYWTNEAKHYHFRAFEGHVITRNCFTEHGKDVKGEGWNKPQTLNEILIEGKEDASSNIRGMEDCRLIQNTQRQEFLGTSKSYADDGMNKIFHVWKEPGAEKWQLKQLPLPPGVAKTECQKNWMGFRDASGDLFYIYSFTPFRVCRAETGEYVKEVDVGNMNGYHLKEYRGSAGPVPWSSAAYPDEAYLCVMHKVQSSNEGRRYYHRFMTLNKDLTPSRVSCFVRMTKERVEYWSGMCQSLEGDSYYITYGLKDSEAYLAEMNTRDIENLMLYDLSKGVNSMMPFAERLERLVGY